MDDIVRVGLIGLGEHGSNVTLPALSLIPNAKIVAVCDLVEERSKKAARFAELGTWFNDYNRMIDEVKLDAIVMASTPQMHFEASLVALERGIHVFAEKPPTVTKKQVVELAVLGKKMGLQTGVGLNFRYSEPILQIKHYIVDNELTPAFIGVKHLAAKPKFPIWNLDSLVRSFLLAQAIHPIDTFIYLGGRVKNTRCSSYMNENGLVATINFEFENGGIGNLLTGSNAPNYSTSLEVITNNEIVFQLNHLWDLKLFDKSVIPDGFIDKKRWGATWMPSPLSSGYSRTGYYQELATFFECIIGKTNFSPSFEDLFHVYEILDSIEEQLVPNLIQEVVDNGKT